MGVFGNKIKDVEKDDALKATQTKRKKNGRPAKEYPAGKSLM